MSSNFVKIKLRNVVLHLFHLIYYFTNTTNAVQYWRRLGPLPKDMGLGSSCKSSLQCLLFVPHSHCDWEARVCTCQPYHIQHNSTVCLPASLLGFGCTLNEQCTLKVPNSHCVDGVCQCKENFTRIRRDKCLPPATLDEYCLNDEMCTSADKYTFCKYIIPRIYGKCKCPHSNVVTKDGRCLPRLGSKCFDNDDCNRVTENTDCSGYSCKCKDGYVNSTGTSSCEKIVVIKNVSNLVDDWLNNVNDNLTDGVPSTSLGKSCRTTLECKIRDPYSACINGICECVEKSSECSSFNRGCYNDTFQCRNGKCISWYFVCDKNVNCDDGSDEEGCDKRFKCPKEAFQCNDGTCLSRGSVCNGKWECPDGSDEAQCYRGIKCNRRSHQCKSGQCLPQHTFCNAIADCLDESDEDQAICENSAICPIGTHQCRNKKCRSTAILCSGVDGCGDNSDEELCEVCYCKNPLNS